LSEGGVDTAVEFSVDTNDNTVVDGFSEDGQRFSVAGGDDDQDVRFSGGGGDDRNVRFSTGGDVDQDVWVSVGVDDDRVFVRFSLGGGKDVIALIP